MYSFPTQMRKMSDFWSWVDNTMITSLRAGPWYNGDQPYGQRGYLHDRVSRLMGYAVMRQVRIIKSKKICILHGFPCEMDFSHHESPNPTRVACDQGGIRRQVVRNTSHMETTQNAFSVRTVLTVLAFAIPCLPSQQTHHVETTLSECGILVTLFSTWYQRGKFHTL